MKHANLFFIFLTITLTNLTTAQDEAFVCGTNDTTQYQIQPLVNTAMPLVLIFVDFPEGRKPDGSLPTQDADTVNFHGDTTNNIIDGKGSVNSVGSFGWEIDTSIHPLPQPPPLKMKIRKYTYDDYWDWIFSVGEYYGSRHPDSASHGRLAYGSMKDYYNEVSYGNLTIEPYQTWSGTPDKYHTGVVNRIDTANGKKYVKWIKLPLHKYQYQQYDGLFITHTLDIIDSLHDLPSNHPDYIEFDTTGYRGKISIVLAGGKKGGYASYDRQKMVNQEKMDFNWFHQFNFLKPISEHVHEMGHLLGLSHVIAGSYDVMNTGGWQYAPIHLDCPAHFNPLSKLSLGWIPFKNVARIRSDSGVSLTPIHLSPSINNPMVALVTVYGDAGRDTVWKHSEYFLVEYRKREGFNRFSGGVVVQDTAFKGGALVWHYLNTVDLAGSYARIDPVLKVMNYSQPSFASDLGNTNHFYFQPNQVIDSVSNPNTNSSQEIKTGIRLKSFSSANNNLSFTVKYDRGYPPNYNIFLYKLSQIPSHLNGRVYIENPRLSFYVPYLDTLTIAPNTIIEVKTYRKLNFCFFLRSFGDSLAPINFTGVGYGNYRYKWGGLQFNPHYFDSAQHLQRCVISFADTGLTIMSNIQNYVVKDNKFYNNAVDILLKRPVSSGTPPDTCGVSIGNIYHVGDISYYDKNEFSTMIIRGEWKFNRAPSFTVNQNSTLTFDNTTLFTSGTRQIQNYGTLIFSGVDTFSSFKLTTTSPPQISPGTMVIFDNSSSISSLNGAQTFSTVGNLILKENATLTLDGNINFNFTGNGLELRNNSSLINAKNITVQSNALLQLQAGSSLRFADWSMFTVAGTLVTSGDAGNPAVINLGNYSGAVLTGVLDWNVNSQWQFGTNSSLEVYGTVRVGDNNDATFSPQSNVTVFSSARFEMGDNSSLNINGKFYVLGEPERNVVFTLKDGARTWNGFTVSNLGLFNAVDFAMDNANISGVTRALYIETPIAARITNSTIIGAQQIAVEVVPDLKLEEKGPVEVVVYLENNEITDCERDGIVVTNTSAVVIDNCIITGRYEAPQEPQPPMLAGLHLENASPKILRTTIRNFEHGVWALENSNPVFQDGERGGNNIIRDNFIGMECIASSPVLGITEQGEEGGLNCIHDNFWYDVSLLHESYVSAQNNYWGSPDGPDMHKIYEENSRLYYEPWWADGDPNEREKTSKRKAKQIVPVSKKGNTIESLEENTSPLSVMNPMSSSMRTAIMKRTKKQHTVATGLLKSIIANPSESLWTKQWAVSELLSNATNLSQGNLPAYLRAVLQTQPELTQSIRSALPFALLDEKKVNEALQEWNNNILQYPNSSLECGGLYGKFIVALYRENNLQQATELYSLLEIKYPNASQTFLAMLQLRIADTTNTAKQGAKSGVNEIQTMPKDFVLEQNYPNPFNPVTVIRYQLPVNSFVALKIYEVLGKEVATLVNGYEEAGYKSVEFDASKLSSGIYFYKLFAGNFVATKKLAVMK